MEIVQTKDHVVLHNEMMHAAPVVPLDDRPRLPSGLQSWLGESRGRWDGDTLADERRR